MPNSAAALALTLAALFSLAGANAANLDAAARLPAPVLCPAPAIATAALEIFDLPPAAPLPPELDDPAGVPAAPWSVALEVTPEPVWAALPVPAAATQHAQLSAAAVAISGTEPGALGVLAVACCALALSARGKSVPGPFDHTD